jgi:hypothetical protein
MNEPKAVEELLRSTGIIEFDIELGNTLGCLFKRLFRFNRVDTPGKIAGQRKGRSATAMLSLMLRLRPGVPSLASNVLVAYHECFLSDGAVEPDPGVIAPSRN